MKKILDVLAFLFLTSVVFIGGVLFSTVNIAFSQTGGNTNPLTIVQGAPQGITFPSGRTSLLLSILTNRNALCHYSTTSSAVFDTPGSAPFTLTGSTQHSAQLTNLHDGVFTLFARCKEPSTELISNEFTLSFTIGGEPTNTNTSATNSDQNSNPGNTNTTNTNNSNTNSVGGENTNTNSNSNAQTPPTNTNTTTTTPSNGNTNNTNTNTNVSNSNNQNTTPLEPPQRSERHPILGAELPATTHDVVIGLKTNAASECRFSTASATPFDQMQFTMQHDPVGLMHSKTLFGLPAGKEYFMYVRCKNIVTGRINLDDFIISFKIAAASNATNTQPPANQNTNNNNTAVANSNQTNTTNTNTGGSNNTNSASPSNTPVPPRPPVPPTNPLPRPVIKPQPQNTNTNTGLTNPRPTTLVPRNTVTINQPAVNTRPTASDRVNNETTETNRYWANLGTDTADRYKDYCASFTIFDPAQCKRLVSSEADPLCRSKNILDPVQCDQFLRQNTLPTFCSQGNLGTGLECEKKIVEQNRASLFCGALSPDECDNAVEQNLIGQVAQGIVQKEALTSDLTAAQSQGTTLAAVRAIAAQHNFAETVVSINSTHDTPVILNASPDSAIDVSSQISAHVTLPFVMFLDNDKDGLPNDLETRFGTDPEKADTDSDGFTDLQEIKSGYDPLSTAAVKLIDQPRDGEKAIIDQKPLEQPMLKGNLDASLTLNLENGTQKGEYALSGTAQPNTSLLVYIYSPLPLVLAVKTDSFGNWNYTLKEPLTDTKHAIYTVVADDSGAIVKKSSPFAFFVKEARAVTAPEFLASDQIVAEEPTYSPIKSYYIIFSIGLIAFSLLITILLFVLRHDRHAA